MNSLTLASVIAVRKVSHNLSPCNIPRARKLIVSLWMTSLDGQHIRQSSL